MRTTNDDAWKAELAAVKVLGEKRGAELDRIAAECRERSAEMERLRAKLAEMEKAHSSPRRWSADDSAFLIWVLGFTAGAHIERNGEQGERIFARCRDLYMQMLEMGGNGS